MLLLCDHLYSDDITQSKNRLWLLKNKLMNNETFNDFGFLVSIKLLEYKSIVKEYDNNVGDRLLKLVSDYMMQYMEDHHINYEIVRYREENFLIFMYDLNEEEVEQTVINMQRSMENYKFKHRRKIFSLAFNSAVMQYIKNESFSSVLDQLDEKLFHNKV
jgi:GGDEF domain-containing protein